MDEVRKPFNSMCYTPSSEPYRIWVILSYNTPWQLDSVYLPIHHHHPVIVPFKLRNPFSWDIIAKQTIKVTPWNQKLSVVTGAISVLQVAFHFLLAMPMKSISVSTCPLLRLVFDSEDGGNVFLRNIELSADYTTFSILHLGILNRVLWYTGLLYQTTPCYIPETVILIFAAVRWTYLTYFSQHFPNSEQNVTLTIWLPFCAGYVPFVLLQRLLLPRHIPAVSDSILDSVGTYLDSHFFLSFSHIFQVDAMVA
jgi:hypothetical protein